MAHVGAQKVAAFASPGFAQLLAIQFVTEAGDFVALGLFTLAGAALMMLNGQFYEAGGATGFFLRCADGLMQIIALHQCLALRAILERLEIHTQSPLPHGALFFHPILTLGEHIRLAARCDKSQAACLPSVGSPSCGSSLTHTLGRAC